MKALRPFFVLAVLLPVMYSSTAIADSYYIGRDEGGLYLQTDRHGGWYIGHEDLRYFQPGQQGHYSTGKDASGAYIITDGDHRFYLDIDSRKTQAEQSRIYNRQESDVSTTAKQTPVIITGNQVLVPVLLGYGQNRIEARLLLDTGASITTIHREIAKKLRITKTRKAELIVPGGGTVAVDIARLSYVRVGPSRQPNLVAGIIDHQGPAVSHQGLLGMDFLRNFDYRIDFGRQVIYWE